MAGLKLILLLLILVKSILELLSQEAQRRDTIFKHLSKDIDLKMLQITSHVLVHLDQNIDLQN